MRILTRYLLSELLVTFLLTLVVMTVFLFLVLIGKVAVENGIGLIPLLRMIPYILPQAMQFAVPGSILLATTSIYGRIAQTNELVAVKSLGISPMKMVWPTLIFATLVSFAAVVLNDVAVSWGHNGVKRVVFESLEEIVYGRLRMTRSYSSQQLKMNVKRVVGKKLVKPAISFYASNGKPPTTITADEAEFHTNLAQNTATLSLYNAEVEIGSSASVFHPGRFELPISLDEFSGQRNRSSSPANLPLKDIGPNVEKQEADIDQIKQEMTARASFALCTGRTFELSNSSWHPYEAQLQGAQSRLIRLHIEPNRRWANGFSCLCFVMIGAPMAIRRQHGEFWGSFFVCFLPILIVYYPMLVGCVDAAKEGTLPSWGIWFGNLTLTLWGVWLLRRVVRF